MIARMTTRKTVLLLVIAALAALAVVLLYQSLSQAQENPIHIMPAMSLTYKTDGPAISVGGESISFKEVRRLDYTSRTMWTDTVVQAPTINLGRYGAGSTVGSYQSLDGKTITRYDALTGERETYTHDGDIYLPGPAFSYATIPPATMDAALEYTKSTVTSSTKVCKDEDTCQANVSGTRYRDASGFDLTMYKTDTWFIPLELGSLYEAIEIEVRTE